MHWFPLALISAITLAAADTVMKKYFQGYHGWDLLVVRFCVPGLLLVPFVILHPIPPAPPAFWGWMVILIPMEMGAMVCYLIAIRDSPLYLTLPYLAFTPVFSLLSAYLLLGETVSPDGLAGILLVTSGAYLLNADHFRGHELKGWLAPLRAIFHERGSRLMLLAAIVYSLTSVFSKEAMSYVTPSSFGPFYFFVIGTSVLVVSMIARPRQLRVLGSRIVPLLVAGALMAVMVVTHFLAIAAVEVAYMLSVKRSSLLFGILFGAIMFREQQLFHHFIAGTLMVAGVVLIVV
ncbi:MAG TPA: EamA family transporter [Gammaproteobacteria bacterium]|nr:EamA family transporter [Gammaproteobacteria bacterium]